MFSIFGCGASESTIPPVLHPAPNSQQFRSRPVAYPSSAAATPRVSVTSTERISQARGPRIPAAIEHFNDRMSCDDRFSNMGKLSEEYKSSSVDLSNAPHPSRQITEMTYPQLTRQHPQFMQYYPTPAFAYLPGPPMYHTLPMCPSLMYTPDQTSMDWVLMPSQFPSAQLRMSQARSPEWASETEMALPKVVSLTTASTSETSLPNVEQPIDSQKDTDTPPAANVTNPTVEEHLDESALERPHRQVSTNSVRRRWTKTQACQFIPSEAERSTSSSEPSSSVKKSPSKKLEQIVTDKAKTRCTTRSTVAVKLESESACEKAFSIRGQSLSVESDLLQPLQRRTQENPIPAPKPHKMEPSRPSSRDFHANEAVRIHESGTDPLSPLRALGTLGLDFKECACQQCRTESSSQFNCTLKMWQTMSKRTASPPSIKRKRNDVFNSSRGCNEALQSSRAERETQEIQTPQRRSCMEPKDAVNSAQLGSSTPNTENESIPTEGRSSRPKDNSTLIVQRIAYSVPDENTAPKSSFADVGRTQSSKTDEVDLTLRSELSKLQDGFDLRANFIRMKRGLYAVSLDGSAPCLEDRCATAVPRRRSCHVDENFAIMTERTTLTRPFLSQSTRDPAKLPEVFCYVCVQMLDATRISVRVMDRREVVKHFGSVALAKWLRPENAVFLPKGSRTRSLSLSRAASSTVYTDSSGSAGKKDMLWKNGGQGRLNEFLHFFRASAIRQRPRLDCLQASNFAR